ncbi:hypothetical protein FHS82_002450 [Pseudochelatococcus lubricantis]|uniref:Uncharacterized protein n=1 Tax=Pseudochelatococcus lubricantis TaxID=1538102 RepID=A0ABX0V0U5_9HYPH|nr:hypothetical protein [Pseudochelatococcus lubricantis]NIJ58602.1 hypothetical protein [Pseudochelatococcus lubricantis]
MTWTAAIWVTCTMPIWGVALVFGWQYAICPHLIPARRIEALADLMLAAHGEDAEHEAFEKEVDAWYRSDLRAQGAWRRIRRSLRRRGRPAASAHATSITGSAPHMARRASR